MNEILKELNTVYQMISTIPVTNDFVDVSSAARAKLRRIYGELQKMAEKKE